MSQDEKFEGWGVVEMLGHRRLAGHVGEQTIAGSSLVRVDVPETPGKPGYTKLIGLGSIYCITPTSEEVARRAAAALERWNDPLPVQLPQQIAAGEAPRATPDDSGDDERWLDEPDHDDDEEVDGEDEEEEEAAPQAEPETSSP